jgi:two-component system, LytTR family, response regulator
MYTCIIVDDELPGRKGLSKLISKYFKERLTVLDLSDSLESAVKSIKHHKPEIVFLDIEMPGQNGFKLFDYFPEQDYYVIFTTAFKEYAIDAIKVSAFDYLLKPISREALSSALDRVDNYKPRIPLKSQLNEIVRDQENSEKHAEKIPIPTQNGYRMLDKREIVYCEADENYTKLFLVNEECMLVAQTLIRVEEMLPRKHFFRIHKSYLINLDHVSSYNRNGGFTVTLNNGITLPVAYRRNEEFVKTLKNR